jgi:hypothetical protein
MLIMIEKDAATKVSKEVAGMDEARGFAAMGFHVQLVGEDGGLSPLDPVAVADAPCSSIRLVSWIPADDAFVEIGAERFSDGKKQTKASLAKAIAAWKAAHPE